MAASAGVVLVLALLGWLLVAPRDLASVRMFRVGLAWWAACAAGVLGLVLLAVRRD